MSICLNNCYKKFNTVYHHVQPVQLVITAHTSLEKISEILATHHVIDSAFQFKWLVRLQGCAPIIQAGQYQFPELRSARNVMEQLVAGKTVQHFITIPEGLSSQQVTTIINTAAFLTGSIDDPPLDGTLLPETYAYSFGESRLLVLMRMQTAMQKILQQLWRARSNSCQLTSPMDAVILASIIEKETALPTERSDIAAVFLNRLKFKMPLQSDPTVIYALEQTLQQPLKRNLTRADLKFAHPYNTYYISALPPGPICNPSVEAIKAVLSPAVSDNLYFVADGTGGHVFAKTLKNHQQNHRNWRLIKKTLLKTQLLNVE